MRALITGAAGQDGSILSKILPQLGLHVLGTDYSPTPSRLWRHELLGTAQSVEVRQHGNEDSEGFVRILEEFEPTHVFFMGGKTRTLESVGNLDTFKITNYLAIAGLVERVLEFNSETWIFLPSSSEIFAQDGLVKDEFSHKNPSNPYGEAKSQLLEFSDALVRAGGNITNGILFPHESFLRDSYFIVQKIVSAFKGRLDNSKSAPVRIGNLDSTRDWSSAKALMAAVAELGRIRFVGSVVMGSGESMSIFDVITLVASALGWEAELVTKSEHPYVHISGQTLPLFVADDLRFNATRSSGAVANIGKLRSLVPNFPVQNFRTCLTEMLEYSRTGNYYPF